VTVVYVTHDQEEALRMSDRVAVMQRGRLEQVGAPGELYERPVNRFVADFLGESNFVEGTVVGGVVDGRYVLRTVSGVEVYGLAATPLGEGQRVLAAVRPEKLQVSDAAPSPMNAYKGTVEEIDYVGDATRYRVAVGVDGTLTVKVQNRLATRQYRPGDPVTLTWDPTETRLFPADADGR
jgi:ABC-type Fe3+/spermidine/putrescine transport system ATPase subunit